jgi:hypothetical protein
MKPCNELLSQVCACGCTPMSQHLLRLPRLRGLGAALALRPF